MNTTQRFLFTDLAIRGQHLSVNETWQAMIENRGYNKSIRQLLGELSALAIFLANGMKHPGKLTLQMQGNGKVSLLLVEVANDLNVLKVRGMVRNENTIKEDDCFDMLLGDGQIVATLYNAQTQASFQSIVPKNPKGLIATFEDYFLQSEQLNAKLWVAVTEESVSALLIQKMPEAEVQDGEDWQRVSLLANTVSDGELHELSAEFLLNRLFHEEAIELFEGKAVAYECQQDRQRFEKVIFDLGEQEARNLLKEQGEIAIHNEICNEHLFFDATDVNRIFA